MNLSEEEIQISDNFIMNCQRKLGSGAFGEIYYGYKKGDNSTEVAIKLEVKPTKYPQIFYESQIYTILSENNTSIKVSSSEIADKQPIGIPKLYWCGSQGNYNIMIVELLGSSLENLFNFSGRIFSLKTSVMIIKQMISRIEFIHNKGIIHRDIKPDNFLMGRGKNKSVLYIIDFGLSKKYFNNKMHIHYRDMKNLTGTVRFASINTHLGIEQSRRDDLESIIYVFIYFLKGSLPWQGVKAKNLSEKYNKIMNLKVQTSINNLCKNLPVQINELLFYVRDLQFDQTPDYVHIFKILSNISEKYNIVFDDVYDWTMKEMKADAKKEK